jgi:hypothetical protein
MLLDVVSYHLRGDEQQTPSWHPNVLDAVCLAAELAGVVAHKVAPMQGFGTVTDKTDELLETGHKLGRHGANGAVLRPHFELLIPLPPDQAGPSSPTTWISLHSARGPAEDGEPQPWTSPPV